MLVADGGNFSVESWRAASKITHSAVAKPRAMSLASMLRKIE